MKKYYSRLASVAICCVSISSVRAATVFDIEIDFGASTFTTSQQAAFTNAEATWESLITSYKDPIPAGTTLEISADDLLTSDGPGGLLGSAGPSSGIWVTGGSYLYAGSGSMSFDSADVASLETAGTLEAVILHEMAHVIGIGTLWSASAATGGAAIGFQELYVDGTGQYTGATALAAYQQEFVGQESATYVPVELGGGAGTANGHWNEGDGGGTTGITRVSDGKDMNLMLMSGWLNAGSYISDTTLGSFEDLGYNTTLVLNAVPEPSSALLLLAGFLGLGLRRRRS